MYRGGIFENISLGIRERFRTLLPSSYFSAFADLQRLVLPPNLWDATLRFDMLESLLVDEGIPVMWVPRAATVDALFEAPDDVSRRKVIARRWQGITTDCSKVLSTIETPSLIEHASFVSNAVAAMRDGHVFAAQALAANVLDTVLHQYLAEEHRKSLTSRNETPQFKMQGQATYAMTFAPVWSAYGQYKPKHAAPRTAIPRAYGRHASAHGVSRRQYTRANATIALMLVTSVLKYIDREHQR